MFARQEIFGRFSSCYPTKKLVDIAQMFDVTPQILGHWKSGRRPIPWTHLKKLVDAQNISWDWLIEGKGPKQRQRSRRTAERPFDRHGINQRYLSLLPDSSQTELGKELGINGTTIFKWRHDMEQVPWERLKDAVDSKGVTWEWLLEGR